MTIPRGSLPLLLAALPAWAGIQNVQPFAIPHQPLNAAGSYNVFNCTIDAADKKCAVVVQFPKSGTISAVRFRTNTVTTGATIDVRLETLGADGAPSGTLFGSNTNFNQVIQDPDDNVDFRTVLTSGASGAQGDWVAVVLANPSSSFGNMSFAALSDFWPGNGGTPTAWFYNTSWAKSGQPIMISLEYSDGTYEFLPGIVPMSSSWTGTYNSGSAPNHQGIRFRLPTKVRVRGAWAQAYCGAGSTFNLKLISGGSTALTTLTVDGDALASTSQSDTIQVFFPSSVELEANIYYRLILQPTTTTNCGLEGFNVAAEAVMGATPAGADFHHTSATNPTMEGDWTQTLTRQPVMGLIVDGIEVGSGVAMPAVISH